MKMRIQDAALVLPDQILSHGQLAIENNKIIQIEKAHALESHSQSVSFHNDLVIPGLIDTHVHGAGGYDTMDATAPSLKALRQALLQNGTTAFLATTMSSSFSHLEAVLSNVATAITETAIPDEDTYSQAELIGVHLEGPFLSMSYKGSQLADCIPPDGSEADFAAFSQICRRYPRLVRILTLAAERKDAARLAEFCLSQHIIPSAGHTAVTYAEMKQASAAGIRRMTHTFNAMPAIHHRSPGPVTEGLLNPDIELELIADGIHIHPAALELAFRLKPPEKVTLISDGTRAVGMPNGEYELGGQQTFVTDGIARLADGTIAGSAYPLLQGVRTVVQSLNRPLYEAVRFASLNPAKTLKVDDRLGSLAVGKEATFLRLSQDLKLKEVWVKGRRIYSC